MTNLLRALAVSTLALGLAASAPAGEAAPPYQDDPEVVAKLKALGDGESLLLPPVRHLRDGKEIKGEGRDSPYARDYTNKMVWAPERQTALYAGGNHGAGRTNDVWEFHLGSNAWHCLFAAEGGDHARFKWTLMFSRSIFEKDPGYKMKAEEQKNWDECQAWWKENVGLKDGQYLTKGGGPLIVGHTWDTLVYEPNTKRMIHGTGAYCAQSAWLEHKFSGRPLEEVSKGCGKSPDGKPYKTMWFFDPASRKWVPYASESPLASLQGMGGSLIYVADLKKVVWYYAGQNSPGAPHTMRTWDPVKDEWQELKPNGGKSVAELAFKLKIAPESEQQMAYSAKHKKIVAVLNKTAYAYDVEKNEWSKPNDAIPFTAMDCNTVFACDEASGLFLLADPRSGQLAAFDLAANKWEPVAPKGPGLPKPPYCTGKGYYDPKFNVFVVQSAYTRSMWVYRHKKADRGG
jgi:hypothetical protein